MLSETELQLLKDLDADRREILEMQGRNDLSDTEREYLRSVQTDILPGLADLNALWNLKKTLRANKG